jgi:tetratricopeptide (TPR) repeat protein
MAIAAKMKTSALVYLETGEIARARVFIEEAIEVFTLLDQLFTKAMALETKAQILIAAGELDEARRAIDDSIRILEKSENYPNLVESLWTRILIKARTGEKLPAIKDFRRLSNIAEEHLEEKVADSYLEKFGRLFYLQVDGNFYEKGEDYRRHLIDDALSSSGGQVTATAKQLGISHQNTSLLLKKYPDLCAKHDVKLRKRTTDSRLPKKDQIKITSDDSFAICLQTDRPAYLGLEKGKVIDVRRRLIGELDLSKPVVVQDIHKKFYCGFLVNDFGMFAFEDGRGNLERTFLAGDISEAGQIIGVYDENLNDFIPLENL